MRMNPTQQARLSTLFLPDLCHTRAILITLIVSEALVLAMMLIEGSLLQFSFQRFSIVSFFVQWVCLLSVAIICPLRRGFLQLPAWLASAICIAIVIAVTALVSVVGETLWPENSGINWWWVLNNCAISSIFATMAMRYFYVRSQWQLKRQAELSARLNALQANIRPHFFFNTLNTVASLIASDPEQAENMLLDLAQLFRAVLKNEDSLTTLKDEIELAQRYLNIEQVRLGSRLQAHWQLPERLPDWQVPQLLLQPLLENAVYHGIQPNVEPGHINISVRLVPQGCEIEIDNTLGAKSNLPSNHIGQKNTQARLHAFAAQAKFSIEKTDSHYRVRLMIPEVGK